MFDGGGDQEPKLLPNYLAKNPSMIRRGLGVG